MSALLRSKRRLQYVSFRLASSLRLWLGRRFTLAGHLVVGALVASAALGMDTTRTMAYQAFTFLLFTLATAIVTSVSFRARVDVRRLLPPFASAREPFAYRALVRNRGPRPIAGASLLETLVDPRPTFDEFASAGVPRSAGNRLQRATGYARWSWLVSGRQVAVIPEGPLPPLPAGGEVEVRLETVPLRRGRLAWMGSTIARPDPLGLFKAFARVRCEQSVIVLPRRYPLANASLPGTRKYQQGGVALAGSIGDSEEFVSLREYRPGDPRRRLHWKSWAKLGKPIVKEYQEEFFVRHALVLDTFTTFADERFEEAVSVAASFACTVDTQESLLDLLFVGAEAYCFSSGRGLGTTARMLEVLAGVQACGHRPFADLHRLVIERAGSLSGCIAVLLGWDADRRRFVERLGQLGIPTLTLVVVPSGAPAIESAPGVTAPVHRLEVGRIAEGLGRL